MKAKLINHSPIWILEYAARKCTGTTNKCKSVGDELTTEGLRLISDVIIKQKRLDNFREYIKKVAYDKIDWSFEDLDNAIDKLFDPKHESVLEHIVYTFELEFSRAVLQEIARHRIASLSVESTRYALRKILNGDVKFHEIGNLDVDSRNYSTLNSICDYNAPNDIRKYAIPEALMTSCVWTINARSLRNFLSLRSRKNALKEIRDLSMCIYREIPDTHKFMFLDVFDFDGVK